MTWTRLSDTFTDQPAFLSVSRSARLLHIEALVWCNRMETDGEFPASAIRRLTDVENTDELIVELVTAGLWATSASAGGWELDWSDQESAAVVRERRAYRQATQKRYRDRQAKHGRNDHSMCDPKRCAKAVTGNATDNATGNKARHETPSRPAPSRPLGRDRDRAATASAASGSPEARCEHDRVNGRAVKGAGAHASRVCAECEAADPAPPQERAS